LHPSEFLSSCCVGKFWLLKYRVVRLGFAKSEGDPSGCGVSCVGFEE